jgi:hypothetical protein
MPELRRDRPARQDRDSDHHDRIRQALKLLADEVRERVERHPLGHLLDGRGEAVDLRLLLPTAASKNGTLERASREAGEALQAALQSLLLHAAVIHPGRVFCLRCQSALCGHGAPPEARQVFAGYGPTGVPRFRDFGQWLLERRDPRVDLLYREQPALLTVLDSGAALDGALPQFRDTEAGYRLHGQVAAGWYLDRGTAGLRPFAVSFQLVSSRSGRDRRRHGINVLGVAPDGGPLEHLFDRTGEIPWADAVRWAQQALGNVEHAARARRLAEEQVEERLEGILGGLARRLDKGFRGKERRTLHGQQRHIEGDRPTRMALADLARAAREDLLFDVRKGTLVVVGERGRAHVFSPEGKLVTSVRYNPAAIARRREQGSWRPATPAEVEALRTRLAARREDAEAEASTSREP